MGIEPVAEKLVKIDTEHDVFRLVAQRVEKRGPDPCAIDIFIQ